MLPPDSKQFQELNDFKPNMGEELPSLIAGMIVNKTPSNLNVGDVNHFLDMLVSAQSGTERESVFRDVHTHLSALEQKWFLRFIIGSGKQAHGLGVGFKQDGVFNFLCRGKIVKERYDANSSLKKFVLVAG